ncbi:MAG: nuclear transport factor 2 family protein [Caulobacter sp.]|nr:nuclear transport factor 2 family protein [Caulobacter sp.]
MIRIVVAAFAVALAAAPPPARAAEAPAAAAEAPPTEAERVARAYIDRYSAADWDGMAALMAPDFVLIDRTNPDPDFTPRYGSPAEALAMLRRFSAAAGLIELGFDFPLVFESNGVVVFQGWVNALSTGPTPDAAVKWRTRQVSVITVRNGKVVHHEDFADYDAAVVSREPLAAD